MSVPPPAPQPAPGRGFRARVAPWLVLLVCVALATAVLRLSAPAYDFQPARTVVGRAAPLDGGELTVTAVRAGTVLAPADGGDPVTTPGMFVVLDVAADAGVEKMIVNAAELTSGEHRYQPFRSLGITAPPGFRSEGAVVFEVDPAHIDDLTATLWRAEVVSGRERRVILPLGITEANAERWRASATGRRLLVATYPDAVPR